MSGRVTLVLVVSVLAVALGLVSDGRSAGGGVTEVEAHQCMCGEYFIDYRAQCPSTAGLCGHFCMYTRCDSCAAHWTHTHCLCEVGCCPERHTHYMGACDSWSWHLYDPNSGLRSWKRCSSHTGDTDTRVEWYRGRDPKFERFHSPNVGEMFGLIARPLVAPEYAEATEREDFTHSQCFLEDDSFLELQPTPRMGGFAPVPPDGGVWWHGLTDKGGPLDPLDVERVFDLQGSESPLGRAGVYGGTPVPDFTVLAEIAGGEGAPVLEEVDGPNAGALTLVASGGGGGTMEGRWWPYNGLAPSDVRRPYAPLSEGVSVDGAFGVYSFQVRERHADGTVTEGSNVVHRMAGVDVDAPGSMDLVEFAGGAGAPVLDAVVDEGATALLSVSGAGSDVVQVRHWGYGGFTRREGVGPQAAPLPPSSVRVPYEDMDPSGRLTVKDKRGIYSFQARLLRADGTVSEGSNVIHLMTGVQAANVMVTEKPWPEPTRFFYYPTPTPLPRPTPLPTIEGVVRPTAPEIVGGLQVEDVVGEVVLTLSGGSPGMLQYRWQMHGDYGVELRPLWQLHGGYGVTLGQVSWTDAGSVTTSLTIRELPGVTLGSMEAPSLFDFEVRVVDADGVPGDPSNTHTMMVWGHSEVPHPTEKPAVQRREGLDPLVVEFLDSGLGEFEGLVLGGGVGFE